MFNLLFHRLFFYTTLCVIAVSPYSGAFAEDKPRDAAEIFERHAAAAVKIWVVDQVSEAKTVIGTGFFVDEHGYLVTNYHVISKWVHAPEKYRIEYLDDEKNSHPLQLLNIDVVNDLAIARAEAVANNYLHFSDSETIQQGARVFSFGYPHDYGITIVEGTYNGFLEHAFYKKIHFTGSLNSGMSGGPAVNEAGDVVGVNVASSGNQVSFLVPVEYARNLYKSTMVGGYQPPKSFVKLVEQQLIEYQQVYVAEKLFVEGETVDMGGYQVPTKPAQFFNCWGSSSDSDDEMTLRTDHQCSADDYLFISNQHTQGSAYIHHIFLESLGLNDYQFSHLYSSDFSHHPSRLWADAEEVTQFRCQSDGLEHNNEQFKTAFCLRRYRKMDELYDAVFKLAILGDAQRGLTSELILTGVTFETAVTVSKRYLGLFSWIK
ncbi:MAG: serine protease [Gammaproteobacteria bacterium]|nr:serine protease [Gammaproteobacteria bacterium]